MYFGMRHVSNINSFIIQVLFKLLLSRVPNWNFLIVPSRSTYWVVNFGQFVPSRSTYWVVNFGQFFLGIRYNWSRIFRLYRLRCYSLTSC